MLEIFDTAHVDPSGLFLATSPWPMVAIVSSYLIFVLKGRTFMEKRKAYDLRSVLKVYNLIQILYNASLFVTVSLENLKEKQFTTTEAVTGS